MSALQLNVLCPKGQEVPCAKALMSQVPAAALPILVALAAEIVTEHESRVNGSKVIVANGSNVEEVLRGLRA